MYFNRKENLPRFIAMKVNNQFDSTSLPQEADNIFGWSRNSLFLWNAKFHYHPQKFTFGKYPEIWRLIFLECDAVKFGKYLARFRRNQTSTSSWRLYTIQFPSLKNMNMATVRHYSHLGSWNIVQEQILLMLRNGFFDALQSRYWQRR
jgi:hypothetical protein